VGAPISLAGSARDGEGRPLPASALSWTVTLAHCPEACHEHPLHAIAARSEVAFPGPDHEYPMHLLVTLTAVDPRGLAGTARVVLQPRTTVVTVDSVPGGLNLAWNGEVERTPFSRTVIVGSANSVSAPSQVTGAIAHRFARWSDGGAQSHALVVRSDGETYRAVFAPLPIAPLEQRAGAVIVQGPHSRTDGEDDRERVRDGIRPEPGLARADQQYSSRGRAPAIGEVGFIGYTFSEPRTFARLVFQEGALTEDGGFFDSLDVEVRRRGRWQVVHGLRTRPGYAGSNATSWETFVFDFEPVVGDAIRLIGRPGGVARFFTVAELEVWGTRRSP
jgi:hypothetical protein